MMVTFNSNNSFFTLDSAKFNGYLNPDFAIEKNEAILSSLNKISTAKQLDFSNLND